jgi:hypothetical protein
VDADLPGPVLQVLTGDNRITLSSQTLPEIAVRPGEEGVPLIHLLAANSFDQPRTLVGLTLSNAGSGDGDAEQLDSSWQALQLWSDDGDGVFAADLDTLLAAGFFTAGRAELTGFNWVLPADLQRQLFVVANISLTNAADGDRLAANLADVADVIFAEGTGAAAAYPLDSGRLLTVDGMVAEQVFNHGAPVATVGPGEGPVLGLDLTLPGNGYRSDLLEHLKVINSGNATEEELAGLALWSDGNGNGQWDGPGGGDSALGSLAWLDGVWQTGLSSIPIPAGGLRVFVTFTVSPSLADSATVRLALPLGGLSMESDNDGPLDNLVRNAEQQILSPSTLLSSLDIDPDASILDQEITVTMTVRNLSGELINGIQPSELTAVGDGDLAFVSGPSPDSLQLGGGAIGQFTWTYRAAAAGQVQLRGSTSGRGEDSGLTHISLETASGSHGVYLASEQLSLHAVEAMPFFVNQGQTGVVPLHLSFSHEAEGGTSDIELRGFVLSLLDPLGGGIVPTDLFSRVTVNEGGEIYLVKDLLETVGNEIDLQLDEPVLIRTGEPVTVDIQVDIAEAAAVPEFFVVIQDSLAFDAVDATSGLVVGVSLDSGLFPVEAGPARVYAPAETLLVALAAEEAIGVGQGQAAISLATLVLDNPGLPDIGADIRTTSFALCLVDSTGESILPANTLLDRIRVLDESTGQAYLDRALSAEDDSVLTLVPSPLINTVAGEARRLILSGDIREDAPPLIFRTCLDQAADFQAQDANSAEPVTVIYDTSPLLGRNLSIESTVEGLLSRRLAQAPDSIGVGGSLPLLTLRPRHPGGPESASLSNVGLSLRFWDEARDSLVPGQYFETLRLSWNGGEVAVLNTPPSFGGSAYLALPDLILAAGDSVTVEIAGDLKIDALPGFLEVALDGPGWRCADVNTGAPVALGAETGEALPHLSGLIWLEAAPRDLLVGVTNLMPPVLAPDASELPCLALTLANPAATGAGAVPLLACTFHASDRQGETLPLGAALSSLRLYRDGVLWAESAELSPDSLVARLSAAAPLYVEPGQPESLELRGLLREGFDGGSLRLGLDAGDLELLQPTNPLLAIQVSAAAGQSFPLWSEEGNFSAVDLAASYSNFPNPFAAGRGETTFTYFLSGEARVSLRLWSARGDEVRSVLDGVLRSAGLQQDDHWDGRNGRGAVVQNGVYLAELNVNYVNGGSERLLRKVAVLR